ncbi:protein of unknown function [Brevefilum fermentans]|uniref:Uncharacterized protein n=1 Tax=Candidatus Brevifilum fermentans TaxID=1986204 RepID=A0A1Y6KAN8_9CHLR|nr:protein of unknown function [Brevefilum fermentans]
MGAGSAGEESILCRLNFSDGVKANVNPLDLTNESYSDDNVARGEVSF